jgi:hypothetical protein
MAASNVLPFCSRPTLAEMGVLELKNFSQFAVIAAVAPVLLDLLAGGELAGAELPTGAGDPEETAGEPDPELAADVLELLLQAATVAASSRPRARPRDTRKAGAVRGNRTTRLLGHGQMS